MIVINSHKKSKESCQNNRLFVLYQNIYGNAASLAIKKSKEE